MDNMACRRSGCLPCRLRNRAGDRASVSEALVSTPPTVLSTEIPAETADASQDREADLAAEGNTEEMQHDYRPGMENTMSQYIRKPAINAGKLTRQDQMLYFFKDNSLYKMPVGGSYALDAVYLCPTDRPVEIQVLGYWIYADMYKRLDRISTDGATIETVIPEKADNTFVVRGSDVFYIFQDMKQVSASTKRFTSGLRKLDTVTGVEETLFSYEDVKEIEVYGYTKDVLLFSDPVTGEVCFFTFDGGSVSAAPGIMQTATAFYVMQNGFLCYTDALYLCLPEKNYEPELWYGGDMSNIVQNLSKKGCTLAAEDMLFSLDASGNIAHGMVMIRNGQMAMVNDDKPTDMIWVGDGYLYYIHGFSGKNRYYRVLPDGSDWEEVTWLN